MFGWLEFILIAVAVLVLFGGKKLPGLARGMGAAFTNFKKGLKDRGIEEDDPGEKPDAIRRVPDAEVESRKDPDKTK